MEEDPAIQIFGSEDFDLYNTLELEKDASQNEIKKAYRRLALRFHPDKQASETKETSREDAVTKFQQVGYAYAVLSDDKRKEKYDKTGNTTEGVGFGPGESGSWDAYFKELWSGEVSAATIDEFFNTYEGSAEEKEELYAAYNDSKGDIEHILSHVMSRNATTAEDRFTSIIQTAITNNDLKATSKWKKSSKDLKGKEKRSKDVAKEAKEAEEMAKELGVHDKLFGGSSAKTKGKKAADSKESDEDSLKALIQQRGKARMEASISALEAKYTAMENEAASKKKRSTKRKPDHAEEEEEAEQTSKNSKKQDMPTEEEFAALQAKLFAKDSAPSTSGKGKKGKKAKN